MAQLNLPDIQGFILRGYMMPSLRVFLLRIGNAPAAKSVLSAMVDGDAAGVPQIATAAPWPGAKPDFCVNLSVTATGLRALGLNDDSLRSFPEEFVEGALTRAERIGDVDLNAPEHWKPEFNGDGIHALVILFAQTPDILEHTSARLRDGFSRETAFSELSSYDGNNLPEDLSHFGYRDGFSQPFIEGGPPSTVPTKLPPAPTGEFLLGYDSQFTAFQYPLPSPKELGINGSFVAFRMLEQDTAGFDRFLRDAPAKYGISGELLAAKLCGRWRNGVPLALSPETDSPDPKLPDAEFNNFDYVKTDANPDAVDDRKGYRCPIGSHIRRLNPRGSRVAGDGALKHRIVRRGLPYGPPFNPEHPDDGKERGLLGLFIAVSLKDQFEFLMKDWVNTGDFAPGITGTKDAILGGHGADGGKLVIPVEGGRPLVIAGFSQFVRTRGSVYGFLPSVTAIRQLAALPNALPAAV